MPPREPCSRRRRRKIIPARWSRWAHSRRKAAADRRIPTAAKAYYERAAALGDEDAKKALKRMECPYAIKDKRGNFVTNLCF